MSNDHNNAMEKMADRPALTEPATEAGKRLHATLFGMAEPRRIREEDILAIEAEAIQREREALVERVAQALRFRHLNRPPALSTSEPFVPEQYIAEARRLLGLDA